MLLLSHVIVIKTFVVIDLLVNLKLLIMHSEEASVKENVNKWALCTCVCFLTILW